MNRPAPTKLHSFFFQSRRLRMPFTLQSTAANCLAAMLVCTVMLPASAFQYPKYLRFSHAIDAPIAARNLCRTYAWACSSSVGNRSISRADLNAIDLVNRRVNQNVREISDRDQFRANDVWTLPTALGGDCEDFALLKKQELIKRNFPAQSLLIATVLDTKGRGHAVLVVRTNQGDLILDSLSGQIRNWSQTGYTFLRMQDPEAPSRWVSLAMANY